MPASTGAISRYSNPRTAQYRTSVSMLLHHHLDMFPAETDVKQYGIVCKHGVLSEGI